MTSLLVLFIYISAPHIIVVIFRELIILLTHIIVKLYILFLSYIHKPHELAILIVPYMGQVKGVFWTSQR